MSKTAWIVIGVAAAYFLVIRPAMKAASDKKA